MGEERNVSANGTSASGNCCSSRERIWLMKGGEHVEQPERFGWKISEVERLVGLSRRDIQRCCYSGTGGFGLLSPGDGGWGRRTYDERDLAMLFLVAERRRDGMTLSQAARKLKEECESQTLAEIVADDASRLSDLLDELYGRYVRMEALSAALDSDLSRELRLRGLRDRMQALADVVADGPKGTEEIELPGLELVEELIDHSS